MFAVVASVAEPLRHFAMMCSQRNSGMQNAKKRKSSLLAATAPDLIVLVARP